jgi:hypothetical protein
MNRWWALNQSLSSVGSLERASQGRGREQNGYSGEIMFPPIVGPRKREKVMNYIGDRQRPDGGRSTSSIREGQIMCRAEGARSIRASVIESRYVPVLFRIVCGWRGSVEG